ncbi:MAG: hypothetical protein ACYDHX_07860 [Methanothrix sp.]
MSQRKGSKGPAYRAGEKARKDEENAKFGVGRNPFWHTWPGVR